MVLEVTAGDQVGQARAVRAVMAVPVVVVEVAGAQAEEVVAAGA